MQKRDRRKRKSTSASRSWGDHSPGYIDILRGIGGYTDQRKFPATAAVAVSQRKTLISVVDDRMIRLVTQSKNQFRGSLQKIDRSQSKDFTAEMYRKYESLEREIRGHDHLPEVEPKIVSMIKDEVLIPASGSKDRRYTAVIDQGTVRVLDRIRVDGVNAVWALLGHYQVGPHERKVLQDTLLKQLLAIYRNATNPDSNDPEGDVNALVKQLQEADDIERPLKPLFNRRPYNTWVRTGYLPVLIFMMTTGVGNFGLDQYLLAETSETFSELEEDEEERKLRLRGGPEPDPEAALPDSERRDPLVADAIVRLPKSMTAIIRGCRVDFEWKKGRTYSVKQSEINEENFEEFIALLEARAALAEAQYSENFERLTVTEDDTKAFKNELPFDNSTGLAEQLTCLHSPMLYLFKKVDTPSSKNYYEVQQKWITYEDRCVLAGELRKVAEKLNAEFNKARIDTIDSSVLPIGGEIRNAPGSASGVGDQCSLVHLTSEWAKLFLSATEIEQLEAMAEATLPDLDRLETAITLVREKRLHECVFGKDGKPSLSQANAWLERQKSQRLDSESKQEVVYAIQWLRAKHGFRIQLEDDGETVDAYVGIRVIRDGRLVQFRFRESGSERRAITTVVQLPDSLTLAK